MSETSYIAILVALIGGIPSFLMAFAAFRSSRTNGRKADEIHILVNSRMTTLKAELAAANLRIRHLEEVLASTQDAA